MSALKTIQLMRGFAAVAVVALHVDVILAQTRYGSNHTFANFGMMGWLGVNFFFVISGYIIFNAHERDIGNPAALLRYYFQRATRLFPIYWILLIAFLATSNLLALNKGWDFGDLLVGFTLLPLSEYPDLPIQVAWTLLFEIKFYVIFSFLIISRIIGTMVVVTWFSILVVISLFNPISKWTGFGLIDILNIWNLNFLVGMAAFCLLKRMNRRLGWPLLLAGLAILWCLAANPISMPDGLLSFSFMALSAVSFGLIVVGAVIIEQSFEQLDIPKVYLLLGDASYSIYLVHSAVISSIAIVANKFGVNQGLIIVVFAFLFSIFVGVIVHIWIEQPVLNFIRNKRYRLI